MGGSLPQQGGAQGGEGPQPGSPQHLVRDVPVADDHVSPLAVDVKVEGGAGAVGAQHQRLVFGRDRLSPHPPLVAALDALPVLGGEDLQEGHALQVLWSVEQQRRRAVAGKGDPAAPDHHRAGAGNLVRAVQV